MSQSSNSQTKKKTENIDRNQNDPFYRYKMPTLIIGHRHARTYLDNIDEIFACLTKYADNAEKRNIDEIMKWFNYNMAANVKENFLSGKHPDEKLVESLHAYIANYVLCGSCFNPETTLFVFNKTVWTNCKACGKECAVECKFPKYHKYLISLGIKKA